MAQLAGTRRIRGISLSTMVSPLECVVTKNAPLSPVEYVLTKTLDLKSFGFRTYEKRVGGGMGGLAPQPSRPCWSTPAMTRVVVLRAGFGGPLATFELYRIYRGCPVTAPSARIAVPKGDPRCHPSGK